MKLRHPNLCKPVFEGVRARQWLLNEHVVVDFFCNDLNIRVSW
jgi:hypothetical protein